MNIIHKMPLNFAFPQPKSVLLVSACAIGAGGEININGSLCSDQ